jgi:hypothetical protein
MEILASCGSAAIGSRNVIRGKINNRQRKRDSMVGGELLLIAIGVTGLLVSRLLTDNSWKEAGLADASYEEKKAMADAGIVPKYISKIFLISWIVVVIGIVLLGSVDKIMAAVLSAIVCLIFARP